MDIHAVDMDSVTIQIEISHGDKKLLVVKIAADLENDTMSTITIVVVDVS